MKSLYRSASRRSRALSHLMALDAPLPETFHLPLSPAHLYSLRGARWRQALLAEHCGALIMLLIGPAPALLTFSLEGNTLSLTEMHGSLAGHPHAALCMTLLTTYLGFQNHVPAATRRLHGLAL